MQIILRSSFSLILLFLVYNGAAQVPQYDDYPATKIYNGKNAKPIITKDDRMFRTRIRWASKGKRDFAGEYIFVQFGCGMSCRATFALNARTGRVVWLPFSLCCWDSIDTDPVKYRLNSRLLEIRGVRNEGMDEYAGDKGNDVHYYELRNGKFRFVKTFRGKNPQ